MLGIPLCPSHNRSCCPCFCAVRPGRRRVPAAAARRGLTPSAGVPAVGPDLEFLRSAAPATLSQEELGKAVEEAFEETFWGALAAPRVLDSYRRLLAGREYERHWPGLGLQVANSYIKGLTAAPLPDIQAPGYEWLLAVEQQVGVCARGAVQRAQRVVCLGCGGLSPGCCCLVAAWLPPASPACSCTGATLHTGSPRCSLPSAPPSRPGLLSHPSAVLFCLVPAPPPPHRRRMRSCESSAR